MTPPACLPTVIAPPAIEVANMLSSGGTELIDSFSYNPTSIDKIYIATSISHYLINTLIMINTLVNSHVHSIDIVKQVGSKRGRG